MEGERQCKGVNIRELVKLLCAKKAKVDLSQLPPVARELTEHRILPSGWYSFGGFVHLLAEPSMPPAAGLLAEFSMLPAAGMLSPSISLLAAVSWGRGRLSVGQGSFA